MHRLLSAHQYVLECIPALCGPEGDRIVHDFRSCIHCRSFLLCCCDRQLHSTSFERRISSNYCDCSSCSHSLPRPVVFTDPGGVPQGWRPSSSSSEDDLEMQSSPLVDQTVEMMTVAASLEITPQSANVRYCKKCCQFKPPRCHHCSVCGRCILKMDHHCIWVANCVGAHNYKFFLLFLLYTFLETMLVTVALLPPFINFFGDIEEDSAFPNDLATTLLGLVLNLAFALSLLGFLIMHMSLVAGNTTTIETYEKKASTRWRFDLGWKRNFEQVFGMRKLYWFVPLYADDDLRQMTVLQGLDYPLRLDMDGQGL
ncbi:hypothetical protein CY35_07G065900 [Sphagnum magellanicum]|uniref:Uncharacterized protein n=1 Tax=Sphagnum magellanicum TaxID=128215 RepID=A0ACB8HLE3_9BRYO|nr:hypothetical protein CY35_07G065900 [Sphagnum magellanicum]